MIRQNEKQQKVQALENEIKALHFKVSARAMLILSGRGWRRQTKESASRA